MWFVSVLGNNEKMSKEISSMLRGRVMRKNREVLTKPYLFPTGEIREDEETLRNPMNEN